MPERVTLSGHSHACPARTFESVGSGWVLGLAAAATFLIFARIDFRPGDKTKAEPAGGTLASATPTLEQKAAALPSYQATGLTQVVYGRHDEGLVFPRGATQPARRVWTPNARRCDGAIGKRARSWPYPIQRRRSRSFRFQVNEYGRRAIGT